MRKSVFNSELRKGDVLKILSISLLFHGAVILVILAFQLKHPQKPLVITTPPPVQMLNIAPPEPIVEPIIEQPPIVEEPQTDPLPPQEEPDLKIPKSKPVQISSSHLFSSSKKISSSKQSAPVVKSSIRISSANKASSQSKMSASKLSSLISSQNNQMIDGMTLPQFSKLKASQTGPIISPVDARLSQYVQTVRAIVQPKWKPPQGIDERDSVQVVVRVKISRDGSHQIEKIISSKNNTLDRLARRAIEISNFPPLPVQYKEDVWIFDYGFNYLNEE